MCSTNAKCAVLKDEGPKEKIDELKTSMRKLKLDMQDDEKQEFYRGMLDTIDVLMSELGLEMNEEPESDPAQLQSGAPCTDERAGPSSPKMSDELSRQPDPVISPAQPQSDGEHPRPSDAPPTEQLAPSSPKKCKLEPREVQVPGAANRKRKPAVREQQPEKRELIRRQLLLMAHSRYCQRRVEGDQCSIPSCIIMKKVLNHTANCPDSESSSTHRISEHYKRCARNYCSVCPPIKEFEKKLASVRTGAAKPSSSTHPPREVKW
ncbi:histone acetyltransferase p300-like [Nasonia vitripennis]|uniref:histone acetyltransferase n=1 Tax=Nasonia vitripennis TaxID=7425 RepID=A0A7M7HGV2_NASVI|nr:histone acetyltransferase p300-like [Nasonia vitripennis]XP_008216523.1 histone acetyltransferase p300-like [Nasonia vitripennis]XP_016839570.1 histone acetyltransferase p300-like [Nasonia vitripennis]